MNSGLLPFIRLTKGGKRRIPLKGLQAWLNGETQPDQKDVNDDYSHSYQEIPGGGEFQKLGTADPQPKQERSIENE